MTKSATNSQKKELAALPLARIDTMDVSYVLPLREYLFTNGCQVFVNNGPTENLTYFFVAGDSNFVKKTLAFRHELGKKQLIICWDYEDHESIDQFLGNHTKIVYLDPVPLTSTVITDIFAFLFTAKGRELNLQRTRDKDIRDIERTATSLITEELILPMEEEPLNPSSVKYEQLEKHRIASLMSDLFGLQVQPVEEQVHAPTEIKKKEPKKRRKIPRWAPVLAIFSLLLLVSPYFLYASSIAARGLVLKRSMADFREGNAQKVKEAIHTQTIWAGYTQLTAPPVLATIKLFAGEKPTQTFERLDVMISMVADVERELLTINDAVLAMGSVLLMEPTDTQRLKPVVAVDTIRKNMPSIRNKLDLISAYLTSLKNADYPPFNLLSAQQLLSEAEQKILNMRQVAEVGERISQIYPVVGGFKEKERALILLQNNSELRPTGGFIGSLAHMTISEGSIEEMRIEDVYTLDGQLKGHIDPPGPVKDLLGQEHWYLRDANWNPDFPKTAEQILFFYEKETGQRAENVIGLTASFIVRILKAVGPVDVPYYNDRITADNFYLKSFYYTQTNFFPGSSQKKDFLGALTEALLIKLQKTPQSGIAIMEIIHDSLKSRDIQWYSTHQEGQRAIEQFGWSGGLPAGTTCLISSEKSPCVFSYLAINEANMSVNKVNAFVDRSQTRSVQISETGAIQETIVRKIRNYSQGETGTGPYTSYMRIYLPTGSTLTDLLLDNQPVPMKESAGIQALPYGEMDTSIPSLLGLGVAFAVEPGRERILTVSVRHNQPLPTDAKEGILTIFEQKQPGIDSLNTTVSVQYPPTWIAKPIPSFSTSHLVAKQGYLEYNSLLSEDSEQSIRFMK